MQYSAIMGRVTLALLLLAAVPALGVVYGPVVRVMPNDSPDGNVPVGSPYGNVNMPLNAAVQRHAWVNWRAENRYWREHYPSRFYYSGDINYSMYEPAYQYGVSLFGESGGQPWERLDKERLREGWNHARGHSNLDWDQAQLATRDAYQRLYGHRNAVGQNAANSSIQH